MSFVSTGGLFRWPGVVSAVVNAPSVGTDNTLDAAGEYTSFVFQAQQAMVVSHVGWRTGTVAGSPTADTRIETVGTDGLPSGTLFGTNTNIVSGTLTSATWTLHALTASATIARGDWFAIKMLYQSGTSLIVQRIVGALPFSLNSPYRVTNTTGSAVKGVIAFGVNVALGSSTTTFYPLENSQATTTITTTAFGNASAGDRRGLRFQVPFPCRAAGIQWHNGTTAGDFNLHLYNDAGTELSSSSTAFEGDRSALVTTSVMRGFFDNAVELSPGNWYRATVEPSSVTTVSVSVATMPSASYLTAWPHQANAHYTTFTTGGGWIDTATDQLPYMDIILDQVGGRPPTINSLDQVR